MATRIINLPDELDLKLKDIALKTGSNESMIIEYALKSYVTEFEAFESLVINNSPKGA